MLFEDDSGYWLALGGSPFNLEPDYFLGREFGFTFIYHYNLSESSAKILVDNIQTHTLYLYDISLPPDTIPFPIFSYGNLLSSSNISIGDINNDGTGDLALMDTSRTYLYLYSIIETSIDDDRTHFPETSALLSAYPNPFNDAINIIYKASGIKKELIKLKIYDIEGKLVRNFGGLKTSNGEGRINWDATDRKGRKVPSGAYFARLECLGESKTIKLIYLK
jgi:hypothetical protein